MAERHLNIELQVVIDAELNAVPNGGFEPGGVNRKGVNSRRYKGEQVETLFVGGVLAIDTCFCVSESNGGAGNSRVSWICDGTLKRGPEFLCHAEL